MTKKCPVCGETFEFIDLRNVPATCGKRECRTNWEYRKKHMDPRTGYMPDVEDVKKW